MTAIAGADQHVESAWQGKAYLCLYFGYVFCAPAMIKSTVHISTVINTSLEEVLRLPHMVTEREYIHKYERTNLVRRVNCTKIV